MLTSNPFAEHARGRIQSLAGQLDKLLFIHYGCGQIEEATTEPVPVYCIVVQYGDGAGQKMFGDAGRNEQQTLDEFAKFVDEHRDQIWVHWSMRSSRYGFDAIARRHQHLNGSPVEVPDQNRFDLSQALLDIYGDNYVGHPRLVRLLEANGMATDELLTADQAQEAWTNGEVERLSANILRRVRGIRELFVLACRGEMKFQAENPPHTDRATPSDAKALQDGPVPPDGFAWQGVIHSGLALKPFGTVSYLWRQPRKTARYGELAEPVYGDREELLPDTAIDGLRKAINHFFRAKGIPFHAQQRNGYLTVCDGSPAATRRKPQSKTAKRRR